MLANRRLAERAAATLISQGGCCALLLSLQARCIFVPVRHSCAAAVNCLADGVQRRGLRNIGVSSLAVFRPDRHLQFGRPPSAGGSGIRACCGSRSHGCHHNPHGSSHNPCCGVLDVLYVKPLRAGVISSMRGEAREEMQRSNDWRSGLPRAHRHSR
jgi:hypothetical protein